MAALSLAEPGGSRDRILDAAEALFARRGYAGVGMREVADAAGLGKSSLFHHFHTKADLYVAVAQRMLDVFERRLTRALAAGGDPRERLDRWVDTLIDLLAEDQRCARLFLRSLFEEDADLVAHEDRRADEAIVRIIAGISMVLREGIDAGLFRPASIPHTVQSIVGLTVYHFASGEFGEQLLGRSTFAPGEVKRRKLEVRGLLHGGLVARSGAGTPP